ncbi:MAG: porin family protein [Alphaproteobacteria bacterium]|nr:porin family protein [Alphaproteobacteria bacterium]
MKTMLKMLTVASAMIIPAAAAHAQAYIGGSLGDAVMVPSVAEDSINQWIDATYPGTPDCSLLVCYNDENAPGAIKIFGGYRFNDYFSAEGYAAYLGTFESYANDGFGIDSYTTTDITTIGVAAVGMFPVSNQASLMAKFGAHTWAMEGVIDLLDTGPGGGTWLTRYQSSGTDFMGGIGVQVDVDGKAAIRLEFEYFTASTASENFGVGMLSIGGMYKF